MMKLVSTLALVLAAGSSLACPGDGMSKDAKVDLSPSVTAALAAQPGPSKAGTEAAAAKSKQDGQPKPEAKKSTS